MKTVLKVFIFCFTPRDSAEKRHLSHAAPGPVSSAILLGHSRPPEHHRNHQPPAVGEPQREKESKTKEREHSDAWKDSGTEEHSLKDTQHSGKDTPISHDSRVSKENVSIRGSSSPYLHQSSLDRPNGDLGLDVPERKVQPFEHQKKTSEVKVKEEQDGATERTSDPPLQAPSTPSLRPPSSMPVPLGAAGVSSQQERTRVVAPFMGVSPIPGADRVPYPAFHWDAMRDPYRTLDIHRRDPLTRDLLLRSESLHRLAVPRLYEADRCYRDREPHDFSRDHSHPLAQLEERDRLNMLREDFEHGRLHPTMQHPALEGHFPQPAPGVMAAGLPSMHYSRVSPTTAHQSVALNKTPSAASLSAPPPLIPMLGARPSSPRRTTPLATDIRDRAVHKDIEAR